jgi:methionyl aminopeptidase
VVLAVEPMVVAGSTEVEVLDDGWSVRTGDGRWAAHTEHTIAVTDHGPVILTAP